MRKIIILSVLISSFAHAYSVDQNRTSKNISEIRELKNDNMSVEFQIGSQRTLSGPDDSSGTKLSATFSKYFQDFSISPQLSYVFFREEGNDTLTIQTQSLEAELWGRYQFWRNPSFHTYVGAGLGARRDSIKTMLMGNTYTTDSEFYTLLSAALGGSWAPKTRIQGLRFTLEFQYHSVPAYEYQDFAFLLGTGVWF